MLTNRINREVLTELSSQQSRIDQNVYRVLRDLRINTVKPTRRGKRGGKRKQKKSDDCSNSLTDYSVSESDTVNNNKELKSNFIKLGLWNSQSVKNKTTSVHELILESDVDALFIFETWLREDGDQSKIAALLPDGYKIIHIPRIGKIGGGLGVIYVKDLVLDQFKVPLHFSSFEVLCCVISCGKKTLRFVCIYRPPPSKNNNATDKLFVLEFTKLCDVLDEMKESTVILGDFNIHYDSKENYLTKKIQKILDEHDFKQYVTCATHHSGHIIDWVLARDESFIYNMEVADKQVSDHFFITFDVDFERPVAPSVEITFRDIKNINIDDFVLELNQSINLEPPFTLDSSQLLDSLHTVLTSLLDKHAPLKSKIIRKRPNTPWFSIEIAEARKNRHSAERSWRKLKSETNRHIFKSARNNTNKLIDKTKSEHYINHINDNKQNPKVLFSTLNYLLGKPQDVVLPRGSDSEVANNFGNYFIEKISKIRLELSPTGTDECLDRSYDGNTFASFHKVTESELKDIILSSKPTSCELDKIPTRFLLLILDNLLPVLTVIVNSSLNCGVVPDCFKQAVIKPLLKKPSMNPEVLKNYRPVSNLPFLSKVLEKVVKKTS
ncbi:hypothetical protein SNE40_023654 [Patella caerulea]|uniref:Endonuclease/exonuclease/phosphatase domain-containing protein n=1 Tax=Patella caerulea TaxID=87958 RepID=A0AAN8J3U6_PATCE